MNIVEFQKKLGELLSMAQANGSKISKEQVEKSLRDLLLTPEQMDKVYEYLAAEKVTVAGRKDETEKAAEAVAEETKKNIRKIVPLDAREQKYLKNYRETLAQLPSMTDAGLAKAVAAAAGGSEEACQRVIEAYMPMVVEIALEVHYGDVFLGDEISEGNLCLLSAVRELEDTVNAEAYMTETVRRGILRLSQELEEQRRSDDNMVEKVRGLEEKIRQITEDGELQFSVDELAIFLDMSKQEIEDILRLTGEGDEK